MTTVHVGSRHYISRKQSVLSYLNHKTMLSIRIAVGLLRQISPLCSTEDILSHNQFDIQASAKRVYKSLRYPIPSRLSNSSRVCK